MGDKDLLQVKLNNEDEGIDNPSLELESSRSHIIRVIPKNDSDEDETYVEEITNNSDTESSDSGDIEEIVIGEGEVVPRSHNSKLFVPGGSDSYKSGSHVKKSKKKADKESNKKPKKEENKETNKKSKKGKGKEFDEVFKIEADNDSDEDSDHDDGKATTKKSGKELKTHKHFGKSKTTKGDIEIIARKNSVSVFENTAELSEVLNLKAKKSEIPITKMDIKQKSFLFTPAPPGILMKCQMNKTNNKDKTLLFTNFIFSLELSSRNESGGKQLQMLMAARSRKKSRTANYIISRECDNIKSRNIGTIGKMRGNFIGSRFEMFQKDKPVNNNNNNENGGADDDDEDDDDDDEDDDDDDENGKKKNKRRSADDNDTDSKLSKKYKSLAVIFYKSGSLTGSKPRKVAVAVPNWDDRCKSFEPTELPKSRDELIAIRDSKIENPNYDCYFNIEPVYNEAKKTYILDFGGRVSESSVKNFALVDKTGKRIFQFGRTDDHFIVDFTYPFCAFQAFCLALSACHRKAAVE